MAIPNNNRFFQQMQETQINRNLIYGILIIGALLFFEVFNFSTTDFALQDLLGDLKFLGIPWATTLAIAFCAIDFAGIARLFTPETGNDEPKEVWYLFGAWLLAATMNATLTWWGVSMAIANHTVLSTSIVEAGTIMKVVPIFVSILVWVIRVLVIGTLSVAGDHLFHTQPTRSASNYRSQNTSRPRLDTANTFTASTRQSNAPLRSPMTARPARTDRNPFTMTNNSPRRGTKEPTYHNMNSEFSANDQNSANKSNDNPQTGGRFFS